MKIFLTLLIIIISPVFAEAVYRSSPDTGVGIFDYIENRRREERANRLTEEQQKLIQDIQNAQIPNPNNIDPNAPAPAIYEGDDMEYDAISGEFVARGKVDIIQVDGHRFTSREATGNTKEQVVRIEGKAHVLQLTPNAPRITLDGYRTVYNYGTKTGTMGAGHGKAGEYYITGKRFEFYPDHVVAYDATQTKCAAGRPDYHLSAEKMEIWSGQVVKMYKIKFWIKDNIIGTKDYDERNVNDTSETNFPKVGYNKDMGAYVEQKFERPLMPHVTGEVKAHVETKQGVRSNGEIRYNNRDFESKVVYGYYHDSDNDWIQKEPSFLINYGRKFGTTHYGYGAQYEIGHWRSDSVESTHQKYDFGVWRDPIIFHKYIMFMYTGYSITKESADKSTVNGLNFATDILREFNDKIAIMAGYHYTKNTTKNSLFDYNNDDYSSKIRTGISYRLDDKNRLVVGADFDGDDGKVQDIDYYWFHDLHCSQLIMRYREKRDKFEAHWQFTPW